MRQPRPLPDRPNVDQLRHQARDLKRAAGRGDPEALERLAAVSKGATLAAAQLAIAREHGFASWEQLKAEVERRAGAAVETTSPHAPTPPATEYVIRPVGSRAELAAVCEVIGAQITPPMTRDDRRFRELRPRFELDRPLMWLAETSGVIVGGALAFRPGGSGITMRAIGIQPQHRRHGLGRRLMEAIELEATQLGVGGINLAAVADAKAFYQRLGYAGRGSMMHKGLPLPGRFQEARLRKLRAASSAS